MPSVLFKYLVTRPEESQGKVRLVLLLVFVWCATSAPVLPWSLLLQQQRQLLLLLLRLLLWCGRQQPACLPSTAVTTDATKVWMLLLPLSLLTVRSIVIPTLPVQLLFIQPVPSPLLSTYIPTYAIASTSIATTSITNSDTESTTATAIMIPTAD